MAVFSRRIAALNAFGYQDAEPLTPHSMNGERPVGRELSLLSLVGMVVAGLTSVLLMGAVLYVSFQGQDTFSTPYKALKPPTPELKANANLTGKGSRTRPVVRNRSEVESIEASIKETENGRDIIRNRPFVRMRATLSTMTTALTQDVPEYDPLDLASQTATDVTDGSLVNTDVYGAQVEGEVSIRTLPLPAFAPRPSISDQAALGFIREALQDVSFEPSGPLLAMQTTRDQAGAPGQRDTLEAGGIAENVTVVPRSISVPTRTERLLTLREPSSLEDILRKNGVAPTAFGAIAMALGNVYPMATLAAGIRIRLLFGPSNDGGDLVLYRLSIYARSAAGSDNHIATAALTDSGRYVLSTPPPPIVFPDEDTEDAPHGSLPTIYQSIWETGRKHDLSDVTIRQIVASFSYETDLNKKIDVGDSIELLWAARESSSDQDLLYASLHLGSTAKEVFRFRDEGGTVGFFDPDGDRGKSFLTRRPLQGGGIVRSPFGYRIHPIFKTRSLHTGVDLAAPMETPIYASADGVVEMAQWYSGYGNYVRLQHVNGYETDYGHMTRFAPATIPGAQVRQGQIIGYVGSTGNSTGPHLHFEIKINGNYVDPLSVKLPASQTLASRDLQLFKRTVLQIRDLMSRPAVATGAFTDAPG